MLLKQLLQLVRLGQHCCASLPLLLLGVGLLLAQLLLQKRKASKEAAPDLSALAAFDSASEETETEKATSSLLGRDSHPQRRSSRLLPVNRRPGFERVKLCVLGVAKALDASGGQGVLFKFVLDFEQLLRQLLDVALLLLL